MSIKYLFLTGGLGNQLFQYSALRSYVADYELVIDVVNGNPRTNSNGDADLLDFQLEDQLTFHKTPMPSLFRKAIGYSLRSSLHPNKIEGTIFWRLSTHFVTSLLLSIHHRKVISTHVLGDLGDDSNFDDTAKSNYLIGYFQSTRWATSLIMKTGAIIKLNNSTPKVEAFRDLAKREKPLVVHIRLGDYVAEGGFGIPGSAYYVEAIKRQLSENSFRKIWLFSDEPLKARTLLPIDLGVEVRIIENETLSSAETLEIMRFGHGYVIGNSTFSWWGAYLSYSENPGVFYPNPWFKDLPSPKNLVPKEWEGLDAQF
jgi:hypothetical protein